MIQSAGEFFANTVRRFLPETFVFAILLTAITMVFAIVFTDTGFQDILKFWIGGMFGNDIIMFAFFIILVLTFGYCLGVSPPLKTFFDFLAKKISTPNGAYLAISLTSLIVMFLNCYLTPVIAVFAMELCRRVKGIDFRLACTAVYGGTVIWHGGFSASAPLMLASEQTVKTFIEQGLLTGVLPISQTLGSTFNIVLAVSCLVVLPLFILLIAPKTVDPQYDAALANKKRSELIPPAEPGPIAEKPTLASLLNNSPVITLLLVIPLAIAAIGMLKMKGLNLASLSLVTLVLGLLFHWRPISYINALNIAVRGIGDILLQFPLFGGIMGIFAKSGLATIFSKGIISLASAKTLPFLAFLSSSIINMFIPSGGGEWLIIGVPLLQAAQSLGADSIRVIVAFCYGDGLTNLLNPFWTLTFLPVMAKLLDLRPKDFMGYTAMLCIVMFIIESLIILLL